MELRLGQRWAWTDAGIKSQRDSERVHSYGTQNDSLHDEFADVISIWRGEKAQDAEQHPATMSEARDVTELCDQLYRLIDSNGLGDVAEQ